jgi:ribosome-binding protein aMBF1 (putative translation factor)
MKGVRRFKDRLAKDLKNPEFQKAFKEEEVFASVAIQIAKIREKKGLSQKDLARLLNTSQQTISRLETPSNYSYSVKTLIKLAHALHKKLEIKFV